MNILSYWIDVRKDALYMKSKYILKMKDMLSIDMLGLQLIWNLDYVLINYIHQIQMSRNTLLMNKENINLGS